MYFELTAPNQRAFKQALWDADLVGLDPEILDEKSLTFSIGTGNIEKVSLIRDKFELTESYINEYESTGYEKGTSWTTRMDFKTE
jgi:hypothetical protein